MNENDLKRINDLYFDRFKSIEEIVALMRNKYSYNEIRDVVFGRIKINNNQKWKDIKYFEKLKREKIYGTKKH